ncbi:MAG: hypothetical protein IK045_08800 [Bacteroidales bacterium]|nr:hypothetical protein [Bacteroidales bacterium]
MKKIISILVAATALLLCALNASAQYVDSFEEDGPMEKCGNGFEYKGEEIFQEDYHKYFNADELSTINSALRQRRTGKFFIFAASPFVLGAGIAFTVALVYGMADANDYTRIKAIINKSLYTSLGFVSVAFTMVSIGVPLFIIGNHRLNWAADSYNQRNSLSFNVVSGRNGLGLALNF